MKKRNSKTELEQSPRLKISELTIVIREMTDVTILRCETFSRSKSG